MLKWVVAVGMSLSVMSALKAETPVLQVLTPAALAELDRLGPPVLSPDGRRIAYTVTRERLATSGAAVTLLVGPATDPGAAAVVMQTDRMLDQVSWSEDGTRLYYLSAASGSPQLWTVAPGVEAPRQVTRYPLGVMTYRLVDRDQLLVTTHDAFPDCADLACSKAELDREAARAKARTPAESGLMYRNGEAPRYLDGFVDKRFVTLFQARLSGAEALTNASAIVQGYRYDVTERNFTPQIDFSVAADGRSVFVALRPSGSNQGDELPKTIYHASLDEGQYRPLINDAGRSVYRPRLSPDGRHLAYLRAEGSEHTAPRITVWVRDLVTQQDRELAASLDVTVGELGWSSDGEKLYAIGPQGTKVRLFEIPLTGRDAYAPVPSAASILQWSSQGGRLALLESRLEQPPEISVMEAGASRARLASTSVASEGASAYGLGDVTPFSFQGWGRERVEGLLLKPARFKAGERYPVVLLMHGGPNGSFADVWSAGMLAPQLFAARGYAVVMLNPHGSAGYGTPFGRSVLRHWADRPLEDFKAGWAYALSAFPFLDGDRACAVGGSYGGYLALMFAGQWREPWKCLVNGQGIFDMQGFFYANDITTYDRLSLADVPWDHAEMERQSPVRFVGKWKTPLFTIAGGRDYRVPIEQTVGAYKASVLRGVPSQLLVFPEEGHGQFNLPNRIRTMEEVLDWVDRWTGSGVNPGH